MNCSHFEYMDCQLELKGVIMQLAVVYRPPPSKQNGLKNNEFFVEWPSFLERFVTVSQDIYIVWDLNVHLDSESNSDSLKFLDTLAVCGLTQHIHEPTHQKGHTLDVVIMNSIFVISEIPVTINIRRISL